jgi:hypothetical protein
MEFIRVEIPVHAQYDPPVIAGAVAVVRKLHGVFIINYPVAVAHHFNGAFLPQPGDQCRQDVIVSQAQV